MADTYIYVGMFVCMPNQLVARVRNFIEWRVVCGLRGREDDQGNDAFDRPRIFTVVFCSAEHVYGSSEAAVDAICIAAMMMPCPPIYQMTATSCTDSHYSGLSKAI